VKRGEILTIVNTLDIGRKTRSEVVELMREGRSEAASSSPAFVPRSDDEPAASHEIGIDIIAWECDYALRLLLARRAGAGPRRADCRRRRRRRHQQDHVENACNFFRWDPFARTPRKQANVGALRAKATDVDVSIRPRKEWARLYAEMQLTKA